MANISNVLSSTQIALEKQAADAFGTAVDDFVRGTLGLGPTEVAPTRIKSREPSVWYASSYAAALAGATSYRPKLKFLFKVEFKFKPGVLESLGNLITSSMKDSLQKNEFTFMIKTVERPKVDFEYEDDVNQYNFRTKVLKKIRHRELSVTFMDDTGNRVFDFFRILMMLYSPITRRQMARDGTTKSPESSTVTGGNGMSFTTPSVDYGNISHRDVINTDVGQALEYIRVKQMFMDPSTPDQNAGPVDPSFPSVNAGPKEVTFDFLNPRVVSFDLDDLSHETSDPNLLTMQFDYDWMEMVSVGRITQADTPTYNITVPNVTNPPVDVLSGVNLPLAPSQTTNPLGGVSPQNPFLSIIARQASRAAQQVTTEAINRTVRNTFGSGRFATDLGGRISGAAGGVVSGIVGAASRSLLSGLGTSPLTTSSRASSPVVSDSATAATDTASSYQSSSSAYAGVNPAANNGG